MKVLFSSHGMFNGVADMLSDDGHEVYSLGGSGATSILGLGKLTSSFRASAMMLRSLSLPDASSLPDESRSFIESELFGYLYVRIPDMMRVLAGLEISKPDVIVVHNDVEAVNRLMCLWGRMNGVPSIHVPHSIHTQSINRGDVFTDIHDIVSATHLAFSGSPQARWYAMRGMKISNMEHVGYLPFDTVLNVNPHPREFLGINDDNPVIVYASSWGQSTNAFGVNDDWSKSYIEFLDRASELGDGFNIIIKTHPNGKNDDWHIKMAKERGLRCMVTSRHKWEVLSSADVVVAYGGSNILIDTALVNDSAVLYTIDGGFDGDVVNEITRHGIDVVFDTYGCSSNEKLLDIYVDGKTIGAGKSLFEYIVEVGNDGNNTILEG